MRWEAKPAPPRVLVSRWPWKQARSGSVTVRYDVLEPPRTRSSEAVHLAASHGLKVDELASGPIGEALVLEKGLSAYLSPPKR